MTTETPAASPEAPAASAGDEKPATEQQSKIDSLIPEGEPAGETKPVEAPKPEESKPAEEPKVHPEWFYANGVKGQGEPPAWWKADKYKTVEDQAKAYPELEKRFGAFKGAPKDGKYEFKVDPDLGVDVQFDPEHPVFQSFNKWAAENQLSQEGYSQVLNMFASYEAAMLPDMAAIKQEVGENADARISAATQWALANLDKSSYEEFRAAMSGHNAASVFKIVESLIGRTRQPAMQKPGADTSVAKASTEDDILAMQAKVDPKTGRRLYETDPKYREMVERKRMEYFASLTQ